MTEAIKWEPKREWHARGKDFVVVVRHHLQPSDNRREGPNRWNVYAYVHPQHWHFAKFDGPDMLQDAARCMPFHGYPSFLRWHYDDDKAPTSVQVGSDYYHLHDDYFTHYATEEDASEVLADAKELFDWLAAGPVGERE